MSEIVYQKLNDEKLDNLIETLQDLPPDDAFDILFNYKFEILAKHPIIAIKLTSLSKELAEAILTK